MRKPCPRSCGSGRKDKLLITQIYEIQEPGEAAEVCRLGVDRVGTVLLSPGAEDAEEIRAAREKVRELMAESSVIPLFSEAAQVLRSISVLSPDIVHLCDALTDSFGAPLDPGPMLELQRTIKKEFPKLRIMRTIPIAPEGRGRRPDPLALARVFAPVSDIFLTDTFLGNGEAAPGGGDPVPGWVGITGLTCDWDEAADLCSESPLPVILAGGLGPDNVYEGILRCRPAGVDSCTRTNAADSEGRPLRFKKHMGRVQRFVSESMRAAQELSAPGSGS